MPLQIPTLEQADALRKNEKAAGNEPGGVDAATTVQEVPTASEPSIIQQDGKQNGKFVLDEAVLDQARYNTAAPDLQQIQTPKFNPADRFNFQSHRRQSTGDHQIVPQPAQSNEVLLQKLKEKFYLFL